MENVCIDYLSARQAIGIRYVCKNVNNTYNCCCVCFIILTKLIYLSYYLKELDFTTFQ